MKVITNTQLKTDNGLTISEGMDCAFRTTQDVDIIATIERITQTDVVISDIQIGKKKVSGKRIVLLKDIIPDSFRYVYYD